MTKIKRVEEFTKKNGKKGWKFFLDNGIEGYISNDKPWEWTEGTEVTYTVQDKGTYKLLTLSPASGAQQTPPPPQNTPEKGISKPIEAFSPQSGVITHLDVFNAKIKVNMSIFEVIVNALADGKLDDKRAQEKLEYYRTYFDGVIDDLAKAK